MKKYIIGLMLLFCFIGEVDAATYYVRADGTASDLSLATGPYTDFTKCMSMNTATYGTYSPGDVVYFSSSGGSFTQGFTAYASGSTGSPITFSNVIGQTPTITSTTDSDGFNLNGHSNIILSGLTINNVAPGYAALAMRGSSSNIYMSNITGNGCSYGILASQAETNVLVDSINIINIGTYGIYYFGSGSNGLTISNSSLIGSMGHGACNISNVNGLSVSNTTLAQQISITGCSGVLTIDNVTDALSSGNGIYLHGNTWNSGSVINSVISNFSGVGIFVLDSGLIISNNNLLGGVGEGTIGIELNGINGIELANNTTTNCALNGIYVLNSHDITMSSNNSSSNPGYGITISGSYNITSTMDISNNNTGNGVMIVDGSHNAVFTKDIASHNGGYGMGDGVSVSADHDITYDHCTCNYNGIKSTTSNNTGFAIHSNSYNIDITNCNANYNTGGGYAAVGNTSGAIRNSMAYYNGGNWSLDSSGVDQNRGGYYMAVAGVNPITDSGWTVTNCVGVGNYPREVFYGITIYNYNKYLPIDTNKFATADAGASNISWSTYHSTQEPNSVIGVGEF